jgi:cytochrome c
MFKLDRKLIISASAVTATVLFTVGCGATLASANSTKVNSTPVLKADISGGVSYPVVNGKTGAYYVNTKAIGMKINHGRIPTANEVKAWDKDIMAGGVGLPEGEGSVEEGEEIYEAKCVSCHGDFGSGGGGYPALSKGNGYEGKETLTNNRYRDPDADGPSRYFGSYWPQLSTMWWYIKDGMPHPRSKTLTNNETYALTAYMLSINEIEYEGEAIDDEFVLSKENFAKIKMPNEKGFEPNIDGPNSLKGIRAYYSKAENFGAKKVKPSERCMKNCQEKTAKIVRIQNGGINEFNPPLSNLKDLPKSKEAIDVKQAYADNCAMCHNNYLPVKSADWAGYTAKGMDAVYKNAIKGTEGGMPPKGGSTFSDADFKLLVNYIINGK